MKVVFAKDGKKGKKFTITDSSNLVNGRGIFAHANLESFTSNLSSLTEGTYMFIYCDNLNTFSSDLSSLTDGRYMFYSCENLKYFTSSDLSSLTDGERMFFNCEKLESFTSNLSSLTNGYDMFASCYKLTSFSSDLSSLQNGGYMFRNTAIKRPHSLQPGDITKTFNPTFKNTNNVIKKLINAQGMFLDCSGLGIWDIDIESIYESETGYENFNGKSMFMYCENLMEFDCHFQTMPAKCDGMFYDCTALECIRTISQGDYDNFIKVESGRYMFSGCKSLTRSKHHKSDGTYTTVNYIDMNLLNLADGEGMFQYCSNCVFSNGLKLGNLISGYGMFASCNGQNWDDVLPKGNDYRTYDLESLVNGNYMFRNTPLRVIYFNSLKNLKCGYNMFYGSQLTQGSVERLKLALPDIRGKNKENDEDWQYTIEGQTYTIDKDYRGVISIQVGKDSSQDYYTDATVQFCGQMADIKGWTVELYNHDNTKHRTFSP